MEMIVSPTFIRFLLVGGFAAAINIGTRFIFSLFMHYELAVIPAYLCGMVTAFTLNRIFVFDTGTDITGQGIRFTLVNAIAFIQVWVVGEVLLRFVFPAVDVQWNREALAHIIAVGSPIVTSYLGHKHYSFAARPVEAGLKPVE